MKSILIRESDQKEFQPINIAHWCDIQSNDGETDSIKWVGGNYYVSAIKGFGYRINPDKPIWKV